MLERNPDISLILPAYNEEGRLPATLTAIRGWIEAQTAVCEVIVVDNGSTDQTVHVAETAMQGLPHFRLLRTDRRGKGLAVRMGVLAARGSVVIFGDSDLSWPVTELARFPELINRTTAIAIGSREGHGARRVGEPLYRHVMGRVFNMIVRYLAVPGVVDTQCGFKAFRRDAAHAIFECQMIDGFGFDVELLFLARRFGYDVREVPLHWEHKDSSRVEPVRDSLRMLMDVLTIRRNSLFGRYARVSSELVPGV
jgi:dolichyl-phosphate beta-glucosyltransferase